MDMLVDAKEALAEAKANNASDEEIQDIERHIENIQKDMQDVPDVTEYESVTKELVKDESGNTYLRASVNTGKGAEAYIWVQNNETGTSETSNGQDRRRAFLCRRRGDYQSGGILAKIKNLRLHSGGQRLQIRRFAGG